jgi:protein-tyrosine phosphatase
MVSSTMKQVSSLPLWLGNSADGRDWRRVLDAGIQAVVQVAAEEPPLQLPRSLLYCRFPIVDGSGNEPWLLTLAVQTLINLIQANVATLLCCGAGLSRSPALAAVAVAKLHDDAPEKCLTHIAEFRPHDVSPAFWQSLRDLG